MLPYIIGAIIGIVIGLAVGIPVGIQRRKKSAEQQIGSAEEEATRIVNEAYKSAESKKREAMVEAKEEIARKCDSLIHPGDTIFLDGSMTAWYIAQRISHRSLTVLTPSLPIASLLAASPSITLVLVGGSFSRSTSSCTGVGACQALEQYFVDKAFLSPRFVSLDQGLTDPTEPEARLRKTAMAHARSVYLAVDSSKLDRTSFAFIAPLSAVTGMISEGVLPEPWRARLEKLGKEIL